MKKIFEGKNDAMRNQFIIMHFYVYPAKSPFVLRGLFILL